MEVDVALNEMPELLPMGYSDSDSDDDSDWGEDQDSDDLGKDGDIEDLEAGDGYDDILKSRPELGHHVRSAIDDMYSHRYEEPRDVPIPCAPPQMPHVLQVLKLERPDHFREILRVSPSTFDQIVEKIKDDPVFFNDSNNPQIPIEEQLVITLYRFGHDGNAAGQAEVARWAGAG